MSSLLNKLADHPNATVDSNVNPSKGVDGAPAAIRNDNDPDKSDTRNWIAKGQGAERDDEYGVQAGSATDPDTTMPAQDDLPSKAKVKELEKSL